MTIISFVKTLPENLVYAPIYKKDALMKSGRKATGKNPLEESWERDFGNHDRDWETNNCHVSFY